MKKILAPIAAVFFLNGCALMSSGDSPATAYYDLAAGKCSWSSAEKAEFRNFSDVTGNGLGVVVRLSDGRILADDLSRFSAPPVQLIRRRLTELFQPAAPGDVLKISGTLCRFEIDRAGGKAVMIMDYYLWYKGENKALRHRVEAKLKGGSGADAFEALESCVLLSARRLDSEVSEFRKQCDKKKETK